MNFFPSPATGFSSGNFFRSNWLYERTPAGDATLAAGKGLSPGFLSLLQAVHAERAVSFSDLARRFPRMDADDLELWLAELCRMQLIGPAAPAELASAFVDAPPTSAVSGTRVLLVHPSPTTRAEWRGFLDALPIELIEAGNLEETNAAYNQMRPAGVIVGPGTSEFNTLNLLHIFKHPRAPRIVKVFLMLDKTAAGQAIDIAAASADETVQAAEWDSLAARVAFHLSLMRPEAPVSAQPTSSSMDFTSAPNRPSPAPACPAQTFNALDFTLAPGRPGPASGTEPEKITTSVAVRWKQQTVDVLYNELIAICAELQEREAPMAQLG
jgi:hypothetical protein